MPPPVDAAERASPPDPARPHELALGIGVQRPHHAGLLARDQQLGPVLGGDDDGGHAEVVVRAGRGGAVLEAGRQAGHVPRVVLPPLEGPHGLARLHVERGEGVAAAGRRARVVLAGPDVEEAAPGVDRRTGPHRRPGGREEPCPGLVLAHVPRLLGHGPELPQGFARLRREGGDPAAGCAAFVGRIAGADDLHRGERDEHAPIVDGHASRDDVIRVRPGGGAPAEGAGRRIDRVHVRPEIREEGRLSPVRAVTDRDRTAHGGVPREHPVHTAALEVDRVHFAVRRADDDPVVDDRRLRAHLAHVGEAEDPREFEIRQVRGRQPRPRRVNEARLAAAAPPAGPVHDPLLPRRARTEGRGREAGLDQRLAGEPLRHGAALLRREVLAVSAHAAALQRTQDRARRHGPERREPGGAHRALPCMAFRARSDEHLHAGTVVHGRRVEQPPPRLLGDRRPGTGGQGTGGKGGDESSGDEAHQAFSRTRSSGPAEHRP